MSSRPTRVLGATAVVVVMATGTLATVSPASAAGLTKPPKTQEETSVGGYDFAPHRRAARDGAPQSAKGYRVAAGLAKAVRSEVAVPGASGNWSKAAGTPISVGAPEVDDSDSSDTSFSKTNEQATVEVLSRAATRKAGVDGLVFRVTRGEGTRGTSRASDRAGLPVSVDYSGFKDAIGGDWASRLQLVRLPDCVLVDGPTCADAEPLETENDREKHTVTAVAPASDTSSTLVALAATDSSDQGDFSATPFSASSEWSVGLQTGDFNWSYPIPTVPVPSGLTPDVSIDYSAQSVDGRTQASNNQTSWLGEGQSLESGFIERSYVACSDSQGADKTGDLCWKSDNATMSFQGQGSQLVRIPGTNEWRAKNDEGWRIRRLNDTTPGNGDDNGEYWELTDQDGTRYYFGKERRYPGDTESTGSAWTVPVFGDDAGEPCHDSTFASSWCQQAWRWNLDHVVDTHGNTITYKYTAETNHYGLNDNSAQPTYARGGYLREIDYGQIAGTEDTAPGAARLLFDVAERCTPTADFDCDASKLNSDNASHWPDVPFDRICDDHDSCQDSQSPTFFSRKRLVGIRTQVRSSGAYEDVDSFALSQSFPVAGDGTGRSLFLDSITRTGHSGSTSLTTPTVVFHGTQMANRVLTDGAAPLIKWRVDQINTETGRVIGVNYSAGDCQPGDMPASPSSNTRRCFPVYWQQNIYSPPSLNWFHKYVVTSIVESDMNGTVTPVRTYYNYLGGAAWHYDDNELVKSKYRTWGQYRGYGTVEVRKGDPAETGTTQSYDKYLFLRGMHGDRLPDGPDADSDPDQRLAEVIDDDNGKITDLPRFAGFQREHIQRNGASGAIVSAEIRDPWRSVVTADDGTDQARILRVESVHTRKQLVGTTNYVRTTTSTEYDDYGLPTAVHDAGDDAKSTDSTCTRSFYARDVSRWVLSALSRSQVVGVACTATATAADVLSDKRYSFDGGDFGDAPAKGDVTKEETLSGLATSPEWKVTSRMGYDARGRVISTVDGLGNISSVDYTPSGADSSQLGPVTKQVTTNARSQQTTTSFETGRGTPLSITDSNGKVTSASYDALGRVTAVWKPGHVQGVDNPDTKFSYSLSSSTYSYLASSRLLNDGTYATTYDIYDAMLRSVETQAPSNALATDRVLTTTKYDSRGQKILVLGPYLNSGATPSGTYYSPAVGQIFNNHRYIFDGAGRQTADVYQPKADEATYGWRTTTAYDANKTTVDPPVGGTPTTEVFDARGNVVTHTDHLGTSPAAAGQSTGYTFDGAGRMRSMTDPKGNVWTWAYDLRGNEVSIKDPDKGVGELTYDNNDQLVSAKDARGVSTYTEYDELGRKVGVYDGTSADPAKRRAAWVYDTLVAGQLTSSTRYATPGDPATAYTTQISGYNNRYQPTGSTLTVPAIAGQTDTLAGTYTTSLTYNNDGSLKTKTLPAATGLPSETVTYSYDRLGQLRALGGRDSYVNSSTYSPFGELLQVSMGTTSGKFAFQTWYLDEGSRRLTRNVVSNQAVTGSLLDANYSYDQAGNVTKLADNGGTADIQCFTYDYQRQLKEAWTINSGSCATPSQTVMGTNAGAFWMSYTYDTIGNRLTRTDHVKTGTNNTLYTYTPGVSGATAVPNGTTGAGGPHSVASVVKKIGTTTASTTIYKYDAAGNMVLRGAETDTWDSEGELASTKTGTAAAATNVYDADGNRILRRDPSGAATLYIDSTEIKLTGTTKTSQRWYAFGSKVVATRTAAGVFILTANDQNTGTVQMNASTAAYVKRRFDPFGGARAGTASTGATWNGDRGFLDKPVDVSGLTQVGARYYDNVLGRFISVDPLLDTKSPLQTNAYAYAENNPITMSDPTGLRGWCGDHECAEQKTSGGNGSGTGGSGAGPTNPAPVPPVGNQPSPSGAADRAIAVLRSIAIVVVNPLSFAANAVDLASHVPKAFETTGRHARSGPLSLWRAQMAQKAERLRTGADVPLHRAGPPPLWARPNWNKFSAVMDTKLVRRVGLVGSVASVGLDFAEHKNDGDSNTEAALKTTIVTGSAAAGAAILAPVGAGCGPAAPACSAGLGVLGAWAGGEMGGLVTETFDSQIGSVADGLDNVGSFVSDVELRPWKWG